MAANRRKIGKRLGELNVEQEVKRILQEHRGTAGAAAPALTPEAALSIVQQHGLIEDLVRSLDVPARVLASREGGAKAPPAAARDGGPHLLVRVTRGVGFVEHLHLDDEPGGDEAGGKARSAERFRLSGHLLGQRFASKPVRCAVEPRFNVSALIRLGGGGSGSGELSGERLAEDGAGEHLHLVVYREGFGGAGPGAAAERVGTAAVDWRQALAAPGGRWSQTVELRAGGAGAVPAAGAVEVRLEVVPKQRGGAVLLEPRLLRARERRERAVNADFLAKFLARAKQWWVDFTRLDPAFERRHVKVLAAGEDGVQRPVSCFVAPFRPGRLVATPREASYWVGLLGADEGSALLGLGGRPEKWLSFHTVVAKGRAEREEKALLLCSLLLGFGLNAFVCVGKDAHAKGHLWVLTLDEHAAPDAPGAALFWEPTTGQRYGVADCPYAAVGSVFNHRTLCANVQREEAPAAVSWALDDPAAWKPLPCGPEVHLATQVPLQFTILPSGVDVVAEEVRLEREIRLHLIDARGAQGISATRWDDDLGYLLMPALAAYEWEAVNSTAAGGHAEFQQVRPRPDPKPSSSIPLTPPPLLSAQPCRL